MQVINLDILFMNLENDTFLETFEISGKAKIEGIEGIEIVRFIEKGYKV